MAEVTIEGSITPSGDLARGERITVQRTEYVERLIQQGFVIVVEETPTPETEQNDTPADELSNTPSGEFAPEPVEPPARSASRDDWAEYLGSHPDAGIVTADKTRSQLIEEWDEYVERVNGAERDDAAN